jgi:ATP-dependent Clp protease ATP-binding subunit ClpA
MRVPFTTKTPRYRIESVKGDHFDVFNQRKNAIKKAIKLAAEYPGATFLVVKRVNMKDKIIFRFKMEMEFDFDDLQDMCRGIIETYQEKLDKTKYWRKPDVNI